jgi:riboflavin kinase/FMN adenylyltransferase
MKVADTTWHETVIEGVVVLGDQRGRTLGFPTANLILADNAAPHDGVYFAEASCEAGAFGAALSVGRRSTFFVQGGQRLAEVHLLDFDGDLYGTVLRVQTRRWIREQRRFPSQDSLISQLHHDVAEARSQWAGSPGDRRRTTSQGSFS